MDYATFLANIQADTTTNHVGVCYAACNMLQVAGKYVGLVDNYAIYNEMIRLAASQGIIPGAVPAKTIPADWLGDVSAAQS